jgi:hypothetical protein
VSVAQMGAGFNIAWAVGATPFMAWRFWLARLSFG